MVKEIIDALTSFFNAINTPFGVAALALVIVGIVPKIPMLSKYIFQYFNCGQATGGIADLQPVLTDIRKAMSKMTDNDLTHIQKAIDDLGKTTSERMDDFDNKLAAHDKQAGVILEKQKEATKTMDMILNKLMSGK